MTRLALTREDTLTALETLAAGAEEELILAARSFDPATPLVTERLRDLGLATWTDLIPWLTRRGVRLVMAFGDEDPLLASGRHRRAWLAASGFANVAQGDAQILCAPHGQGAGWLTRWRMSRPLARARAELAQDEPRRLTLPQRDALKGRATVVTQHVDNSFAIADGARAVIGGFSLDPRRPETLWQDIAVLIDDRDFSGALRAHFADCWTAAIATQAPSLGSPARPISTVTRRQSRPELRLMRTLSDPARGPLRLTATPRHTSFADRLCRHLEVARRSVYIETPALRHAPYVDALLKAREASPTLEVVLILQPQADRLPLNAALSETPARAHHLQTEQLWRLLRAFGTRLTLLEHRPPGALEAPLTPRPLAGRCVVIDETIAVIGSHDLSARAARLDSHASVLIRDPELARDLLAQRRALWLDSPEADWAEADGRLRRLSPKRERAVSCRLPDALF